MGKNDTVTTKNKPRSITEDVRGGYNPPSLEQRPPPPAKPPAKPKKG